MNLEADVATSSENAGKNGASELAPDKLKLQAVSIRWTARRLLPAPQVFR